MNSTNEPGGFGCDSFAEELSLFVFGELDGERRDALERHLVGCAACRGERDALVRSLELLKVEGARGADETAPQLSPARQANLLAQAQAVAPNAGRVIAWRRAAVAAGVIVTVGAGAFSWQHYVRSNRGAEQAACAALPARGGFARRADSKAEDEVTVLRRVEYVEEQKDRDDALDAAKAAPKPAPAAAADPAPPAAKRAAEERLADGGRRDEPLRRSLDATAASPPGERLQETPAPAKPSGPAGPTTTGPAAPGSPAPAADGAKLDRATAPAVTRAKTGAFRSGESEAAPAAAGDAGKDGEAKREPPAAVDELSDFDGAEEVRTPVRGLSTNPAPTATLDDETRRMLKSLGYAAPESSSSDNEAGPQPSSSDYHATFDWANSESCLFVGVDGGAGWIGGSDPGSSSSNFSLDGFATAAVPALTPAQLGHLLAASLSPAQAMRVQALLVAKLGTPAGQPPRPNLEADRDAVIHSFLDHLSRRQSEPPRDMFFRYFGDHPFIPTRVDAKSTFGMDVDTASYALVRSYLSRGVLPPKAAVRTEEFVNAFRHDLAPPDADGVAKIGRVKDDDRAPAAGLAAPAARDVFAIHTEIAPSPFGEDGQYLLQVGLKAREIPKSRRKPVALTFVIDVSGSMEIDGRLELVKKGLHLLVDQLNERDSVGIVSFETTGHRVLDPVDGSQRGRIFAALDPLRPEGSTNADAGLRLGYDMALSQLRPNAENRVILCSDGVANTGVTDPNWLSARIAECKSKYVYLNCVGVGMGNHNDALMEQLADEGDGFCAYLDRIEEAKKLFVDRLTGTLLTVARDAKIQVEFDPAGVRRFRQLGYEKRALAHRDFRNDKVDAGEVGAGQEVVALYEIELTRDALARDAATRDVKVPLAAVRIRYEDPDAGQVREQERRIDVASIEPTLQQATPRFRLSACVAEFAEILRQSVHARDGSLGAVERLAEPLVDELQGDPDVPEFVALVKQAARLPDLIPSRSGLARAVDEVKKFRCWREELKDGADQEMLRQLEEQDRRLEQALRDALDRALRRS